jgi:hypothetical protein
MKRVTKTAQAVARRRLRKKQASKIAEIHHALVAAGFDTLDEQAAVLKLGRSTAWALLHSDKKVGPSNRILAYIVTAPRLPLKVRLKVNEYIQAKSLGLYGHCDKSIRNLRAQLQNRRLLAPKRPVATRAATKTDLAAKAKSPRPTTAVNQKNKGRPRQGKQLRVV